MYNIYIKYYTLHVYVKACAIKLWELCAKNPRNAGGGGAWVIYKKEVNLKKGQLFIKKINMIYENENPVIPFRGG